MDFKDLLNWTKKKVFRQFQVDNGEIGGMIVNIKQSMFVFSIFNFVMLFGNAYKLYLHQYVSFVVGMLILIMCGMMLVYFYYMFIHPSQIQYANRQGYKHGNYIRRDLENMDERLNHMEILIDKLYDKEINENDFK